MRRHFHSANSFSKSNVQIPTRLLERDAEVPRLASPLPTPHIFSKKKKFLRIKKAIKKIQEKLTVNTRNNSFIMSDLESSSLDNYIITRHTPVNEDYISLF